MISPDPARLEALDAQTLAAFAGIATADLGSTVSLAERRIAVVDRGVGGLLPARRIGTSEVAGGAVAWLQQAASVVLTTTPCSFGEVRPTIIPIPEDPVVAAHDRGETVSNQSAAAAARADSYGIGVPDGWTEYPLEAAAFEASVVQLKRDLLAEGAARADVRRLELMQRQMHQQLLSDNVQFLATLVRRSPGVDPENDGRPSLLLAGLVVSSKHRDELGAPVQVTPSVLLRGFSGSRSSAETGIDLEPPVEVTLPAGRAVRIVRFHSHSVRTGDRTEQIEFYERTFLVPHDDGDRICVVQLVTPTIEYAEPMAELFDAIAETLRIFYPEGPTSFDSARVDGSVTNGTATAGT